MTTNSIETPAVKTASPADEAAVIDVITLAFSADPMARWVFPNPHRYLTCMPRVIRAFAGGAFAHNTALYIDGHLGAALWLPPGVHPDDDVMMPLLQANVAEQRQSDVFAVLEQMGNHHPQEPHWYLPFIGVDPARQGRGLGSLLMQHAIEICDRDRTLAYLESSNPRNITLYKRYGFEPIGAIQAGSSPNLVPMLRKPR